ncbi:unnamed protein product, partial [Rotaria sordida]
PHPGRYDYRYRHLYEDGFDTPPYLPASHYPYDGFFDYEKRKPKSKSKTYKDKKEMNTDHDDREGITDYETEHEDDIKNEKTKKIKNKKTKSKDDDNKNEKPKQQKQQKQQQPQQQQQQQRSSPNYPDPSYDDEHDMLELWRQERNDYLKKKYKPTVHDILYSQQWMKTDSYLENQRRRALRDIQGYYFPYKKYTLKDYKDLQKHDAQNNPYASINEPTPDRKERARKRQEYSSHIERQTGDISGRQNKSPQDTQSRKPWHSSHSEPNDPEKVSKRERALEYAKVQVVKTRSQRAANDKSSSLDPTEKYVNGLFPHNDDDDDEGSVLCKINKNKHLHECFTVLKCGEISTNLSIVFQGFPGLHGSQGVTGLPGPIGPQGLTGPPGRDGFTVQPTSFYAELRHIDITKNFDRILRPWTVSDLFNIPNVLNYFSKHTGIFTVPTKGLYQFFLTITVSSIKASFYITKNGQDMCTVRLESIVISHNKTIVSGLSNGLIDCLLYCQVNDEISIVASNLLNENFDSQPHAYPYLIFSGYMLSEI